MTLTPATIRRDLKCGQGAISPGERCTKGATSSATAPRARSRRRQVALVGAAAVITGAALYAGRKPLRQTGSFLVREATHAAVGRKLRPKINITNKTFENVKATPKSQVLEHEAQRNWETARRATARAARDKTFKSATFAATRIGVAAAKSERNLARKARLTMEYHRRKMEPGYRKPPRRARGDDSMWAAGFGMRGDADGRKGKACGASHIPAGHKCNKGAGGGSFSQPLSKKQEKTFIRSMQKMPSGALKQHARILMNEIEEDIVKQWKKKGRAPSVTEFAEAMERHPKWREIEYAHQADLNKQRNRNLRRMGALAGAAAIGFGGLAVAANRLK